uniref:Major facilitator superfamily (MFS) profile domain-containing protein n=1 Tax=Caenorhabditis japonica TaxID=281687 RepID=A0A8R1HHG1_CAEJA
MIQVGLAYFTREWTRATYLTASISSLALPILWYLPESPIWLEQKDKGEEASRARKRILKIRGGVDEDLEPVQMIALERVNMLTILKSSRLRTSFLVILFMYFYGGMTIYITDLNGADMTQNLYLGQFLSGLVLSVAQFIIGMSEPFITGMGRRVLFLFSQIVAILCYIAIVVFLIYEMKGSYPYLVAYTLGYASQSICLESAYLALVELMPTDVRATVCSIANIAMKLGTIAATFTKPLKYADEPNLFMINMLLGVIGIGVVFFFLQESRSADLRLVGHIDSGPIFSADEEWEIEIVTDPDLEVVAEPKRSPPRTEEARSPKSLPVRSVVKSAEDSKEGSISKDPSGERAKSEEQNSEAAKHKEPSSDGEKSKTPSPKKVNSNTPSPKKAKSRTPTPKKVKSRTPSSNGAKSKISRLKMARSKSPNAKKEISKEPSSHTAKLIERSTEETRTTEPTTEGTMTREQTTEGTITKENTTEVGKSTEPSAKKGRATDPSVKGAKSTEPTVEGGKSTEPSLEGGKSIEPSVKGGKPKQPSEEVAKPTEPSAEGSKPTEPSAEGAKPTEPSAEVAKPKEAEKKSAEGLKAAKSKSKEKSSGSKETPSAEPAKDRKSLKSNKVAVELESIKKNERAKPHTKFKHFKDDFRS